MQNSTESGALEIFVNECMNEQQGSHKLLQAFLAYGHKPISKCQVSKSPDFILYLLRRDLQFLLRSPSPHVSCLSFSLSWLVMSPSHDTSLLVVG